jgi:hypothetical protein
MTFDQGFAKNWFIAQFPADFDDWTLTQLSIQGQ